MPPKLSQLANLRQLWLHGNQLTSVPRSFAGLANLEILDLRDNPLRTPPPEIAEKGAAAVRAYLARLDDTSVVRREAKLLLVGEGGTGKSSLLRALRGQDFDPHLSTTHGVDILPVSLPCPGCDGVDLTLNVWDFGGQQIYHTTHQFFMTRRSLYLLVWNARGTPTRAGSTTGCARSRCWHPARRCCWSPPTATSGRPTSISTASAPRTRRSPAWRRSATRPALASRR